jgi:hypothetical protein
MVQHYSMQNMLVGLGCKSDKILVIMVHQYSLLSVHRGGRADPK